MTNHGEVFTALADATRRTIFERLAAGPAAVGQLAAELPVSRPAVSQHLKVLKDAGLVTDRAEGTRRIYAVNQAGIVVARGYFDQFWTRSLAAFGPRPPGRPQQAAPAGAGQPRRSRQGGTMSTQMDEATSVRTETVVEAGAEHAFEVFTEGIGTWWDPDHHILDGELAEMVFEPHVGGHIVDRATDGTECRWARVLAYEPPSRVVFSWDIDLAWQLETDPARTSEVEVTFTPEGADRTRVVLTHRHLDRHGEGWQAMRDAVGSGWSLAGFAAVASAR